MGQFIHNENNQIIIIDNGGNQSVYDATWWMTQEPSYSLPVGAVLQYYNQTVKRTWHSATGAATDLTIPWADGDTYISNKSIYDVALVAYQYSLISLSEAKAIKIVNAISYESSFKNNGGMQIASDVYNTDVDYLNKLTRECYVYVTVNALALPVGYYVVLDNGTQKIVNGLELVDILDGITEFYYTCDIQLDVHIAAINALSSKSAVTSYDFTTGYPVTPYSFTP